MQIISTVSAMQALRRNLTSSIGLVPTMGYLHEGHLSLVRRARCENDIVIVSIFVNPSQFGPNEDLGTYPRDLEHDLALLREAQVDYVFAPSNDELYPPRYQTWVELSELPQQLEGARRPGHFRGVTTIVSKLFHLTRPTRAYFGQKDAQQALILRRMVADLNFALQMIICPTVREAHGLAMSSRNNYLSAEERQGAGVLYQALQAAQSAYDAGERCAERLREIMRDVLAQEPLARPEYISAADLETLTEIPGLITGPALLSLAVPFAGKARLIDNIWLGTSPDTLPAL
ncbi:MAG: pantoate--beta-alanine ligase [Chloroflexi bacterium]|nr:pantoate--beta-alanine ligase [Chloroflexota bacterium]